MNMLERIFYTSCKEEPLKRTEALSKLFEPLLTCFPINNNNNDQRAKTIKQTKWLQLLKDAKSEDCTIKTDTTDAEPIKRFVNDIFVKKNIDPVHVPIPFKNKSEEDLCKQIFNYYYYTKPSFPHLENPRVITWINGEPYAVDTTVTHNMVNTYCNYWLDIIHRSAVFCKEHLLSEKPKVKIPL